MRCESGEEDLSFELSGAVDGGGEESSERELKGLRTSAGVGSRDERSRGSEDLVRLRGGLVDAMALRLGFRTRVE